jgi:uncharacterized protein YndB with AHSA1/START domain
MGKKILKILLALVGLVVLFAVGVTIYGATQPEEHRFTRAMQLAQPPEKVFEVLTDYTAHPSWRPNVAQTEKLAERDGKPAWRFVQNGVGMTMTVEQAHAPGHLELHFVDEKGVADVTWEFLIGPITGGSQVSVKETGRIHGAFFRGMNRVFGGTMYADQCLQDLAKKFGQEAVIQ